MIGGCPDRPAVLSYLGAVDAGIPLSEALLQQKVRHIRSEVANKERKLRGGWR